MDTDDETQADAAQEAVAVQVPLSSDLLEAIDEFAAHNGYETPDAVVREALARERDRRDE
jgi:metal-responsive CopG/Arc/MetJ family transcriptional regulator